MPNFRIGNSELYKRPVRAVQQCNVGFGNRAEVCICAAQDSGKAVCGAPTDVRPKLPGVSSQPSQKLGLNNNKQ